MLLIKDPVHGSELSAMEGMYPTRIVCWTKTDHLDLSPYDTAYGVCLEGNPSLVPTNPEFPMVGLRENHVFSLTGEFTIKSSEDFKVFLIIRRGYRAMFGVSCVEEKGRLSYIDGCTDTLILPPARAGDPCLNSLHFPPDINQTQHLHPDVRVGVVLSGEGKGYREGHWEVDLTPGCMFILPESEIHSFKTDKLPMRVIAYHPTTDTGPTDQSHPMLNRTYIDHGKR